MRPEYIETLCKSAINRVEGMPFKWSLNPYRGCAHGCQYCYARASHTYFGLNGGADFETKIMVKTNIAEVLALELKKRSWLGELVTMGTVTDCYQPAEGRYRLTREVLEVFRAAGNPINMVTKSPMVLRDVDILAELAGAAGVSIFFTITTVDLDLWRKVEPGTANPFKRLHVMRLLNQAGVKAGVLLAPILPGITDSVASIEAVAEAAADYGASAFSASALRLMPVVKEHYLGFVEEAFPELAERYRRAYPNPNVYAPQDYVERLHRRVERARTKFGLPESTYRQLASSAPPAAPSSGSRQLALLL